MYTCEFEALRFLFQRVYVSLQSFFFYERRYFFYVVSSIRHFIVFQLLLLSLLPSFILLSISSSFRCQLAFILAAFRYFQRRSCRWLLRAAALCAACRVGGLFSLTFLITPAILRIADIVSSPLIRYFLSFIFAIISSFSFSSAGFHFFYEPYLRAEGSRFGFQLDVFSRGTVSASFHLVAIAFFSLYFRMVIFELSRHEALRRQSWYFGERVISAE